MYLAGFRHLLIDDNNVPPLMDSYSLKFACDLDLGGFNASTSYFTDNFKKIKREITDEDLAVAKQLFDSAIEVYFEFPLDRTLIGTHHNGPTTTATKWINIVKERHTGEKHIEHEKKNTIVYVRLFPYK